MHSKAIGSLLLALLSLPLYSHNFDDQILEGEVVVERRDDFSNHQSETRTYLVVRDKGLAPRRYWLRQYSGESLPSGNRIRVKGELRVIESSYDPAPVLEGTVEVLPTPVISGITAASGEQKTLLVAIDLIDSKLPCSNTDIRNLMFRNQNSVNKFYRNSSDGKTFFTGDVVGPLAVSFDTSQCNPTAIADTVEQLLRGEGMNPDRYRRHVFVFPYIQACNFEGLGEVGTIGKRPSRAWVNGACNTTPLYAHELGHNLGIRHASGIDFIRNRIDEYGDFTSVMGNLPLYGSFNAPHRIALGWLPDESVRNVTQSGVFALSYLQKSRMDRNPRVIKIPKRDTAEDYYISFKRAVGFDVNTGGSSIHIWNGDVRTRTFWAGYLGGDLTFNDLANRLVFRELSSNDLGAEIEIQMGEDPGCRRNPVGLSVFRRVQGVHPGNTVSYEVTLENRDSFSCPTSRFDLELNLESALIALQNPIPRQAVLIPGQSADFTFELTAVPTVPEFRISSGVIKVLGFYSMHNTESRFTTLIHHRDVDPPDFPRGVGARINNDGLVHINFFPVIEPEPAFIYTIYRSHLPSGAYESQGHVSAAPILLGLPFVQQLPLKGGPFYYRVSASDRAGNESELSDTVFVSTGSPSLIPVQLRIDEIRPRELLLSWQSTSQGHVGFVIERALGSGDFTTIARAGVDNLRFRDFNLLPDTEYRYRVHVVDYRGERETSTITARTLPEDHLIFISSKVYGANLGGLSGADSQCQLLATRAKLRLHRPWRALLSTDDSSSASRLFFVGPVYNPAPNLPLRKVDNGNRLFQGDLARTVTYNELGGVHSADANVWSGSRGDGSSIPQRNCANWTSTNGNTTAGGSRHDSPQWLNDENVSCRRELRLYCVSQ